MSIKQEELLRHPGAILHKTFSPLIPFILFAIIVTYRSPFATKSPNDYLIFQR